MQRIDNGKNVNAAEGSIPASALKDGDESGEEKINGKVVYDSTMMEEKTFVHDPKLFTGVTPPVETNLFTGVTPPVTHLSHDNESSGNDSNDDGETMNLKMKEDHVSHSSDGLLRKTVGEDLMEDGADTEKDTEMSDETEGKKIQDQKTALKEIPNKEKMAFVVEGNSNPNESTTRNDDDVTNVGKIESQREHDQNEDTEAIKNDAKNIPFLKKITDSDSNGTVFVEKSDTAIVDEGVRLIGKKNGDMVNQEKITGVDALKPILNKTVATGGNAEANNKNTAIFDQDEILVKAEKNTNIESMRAEPNMASVSEEDTETENNSSIFVKESERFEGQERIISDEGNEISVTEENSGTAIDREIEGIRRLEQLRDAESIKGETNQTSVTEGDTETETDGAVVVEESKEMTRQKLNADTEDMKVELIETSFNQSVVLVNNGERIIGHQQKIDAVDVKVEPKESLTKENIYAHGERENEMLDNGGNENNASLVLSEAYDDKYPAEGDLIPPSDTPVEKPTPNDILFGRGGLTNHHPGNRRFRDIVVLHKDDYMKAIKVVKPRVARKIVKAIRTGSPPGRFLKKSSEDNKWYDVGDRNAAEKASQALREKSQNEKKETKAKAKARYKKEDGLKTLGSLLQYGNIPISSNLAIYGKGGTMMPPFPFVTPTMYGIVPPPGVQMPLLPAMPPFATAGMTGDNSQFAKDRGDSLKNTMKNAYSKSSKSNDKSLTKTVTNVKGKDEKDGASLSIIPISNKLTNGNVTSIESGLSTDDKPLTYPTIGGIFGTINADGNIMVTDQDILCGRGGATNHHKGNKRFRDIVGVHRPDYVQAPKVQKPGVARLIVKAIRSGSPPGRFLKKCADGKWFDIGDKRAAEKASQALREKPPDERKSITHANGDYFAFLAQQSAYGMHAGLQGHTYVYPAYPAAIVPQQQISPALFMNFSTGKNVLTNGANVSEKEEQPVEEEIAYKEYSKNIKVDKEDVFGEDGPSTDDSCSPSSPKRQKIEICPKTTESEACSGREVFEVYPKTEV